MKRVDGSSPLTEEQQQHYLENFGVRYSAIAENPLRPPRRVRRAKQGKRGARELNAADGELAKRQHAMAERLRQAQIRPL